MSMVPLGTERSDESQIPVFLTTHAIPIMPHWELIPHFDNCHYSYNGSLGIDLRVSRVEFELSVPHEKVGEETRLSTNS